jgi:predicted PurR-regulated permease PerM
LAESSLPLWVAQVPPRAELKEAIMTSYAFLPAVKALSLRIVNTAYNVSFAASIAFVFLVLIASTLAMAVWGRIIELPDFHRSM